MKRGILHVAIYYGVFLFIALVAFLAKGKRPASGLALHHFIVLLSFLGGLIWLMHILKKYWPNQMTDVRKGVMLAQGLMWIGFLLALYWFAR